MTRNAQEQLRLQMTGNLNTGSEEEVKLHSVLSHTVVQPIPINIISGAIREQSSKVDLPSY